MPFLDTVGVDRPLSFVLEEVYLQGMRDAVQTMEKANETDMVLSVPLAQATPERER